MNLVEVFSGGVIECCDAEVKDEGRKRRGCKDKFRRSWRVEGERGCVQAPFNEQSVDSHRSSLMITSARAPPGQLVPQIPIDSTPNRTPDKKNATFTLL